MRGEDGESAAATNPESTGGIIDAIAFILLAIPIISPCASFGALRLKSPERFDIVKPFEMEKNGVMRKSSHGAPVRV